MSKFSRGASAWKEHRLSDQFEAAGRRFTVKLVARRGTGVQGYRVTLHFLPHDGSAEVQAALPNAASTADVHKAARELEADETRLRDWFDQAQP